MKRVIALIILIILPVALFAVFEWDSESASGDFTGGETSMKVTWDLTDLEIKAEHSYWFTQDGVTTTTAVLIPGVDDGDFVGLGTVVFNWEITSLYGEEVALYLDGPMTSSDGEMLDWTLSWTTGTGDTAYESVLGGDGYGKENAIGIAEHDPLFEGITTSGSVSIECRTGKILQTSFDDYTGHVYVLVTDIGE